jgi:hypothetical protein
MSHGESFAPEPLEQRTAKRLRSQDARGVCAELMKAGVADLAVAPVDGEQMSQLWTDHTKVANKNLAITQPLGLADRLQGRGVKVAGLSLGFAAFDRLAALSSPAHARRLRAA